jgi:hypothetical protein
MGFNWSSTVYDGLDPVYGARDRRIGGDFGRGGHVRVADIAVTNEGRWSHSVKKYLGQQALRGRLEAVFA